MNKDREPPSRLIDRCHEGHLLLQTLKWEIYISLLREKKCYVFTLYIGKCNDVIHAISYPVCNRIVFVCSWYLSFMSPSTLKWDIF